MFERWEEETEAEKERKNSPKIREAESCRSQQRWEFVKGENENAGCYSEVRGEDTRKQRRKYKSI